MNSILKLTAAAAAVASLTACDMLGLNKSGGGNATTASNVAANASAPANSTAAADTGGKPGEAAGAAPAAAPFTGQANSAFLVGRWTDNNDCTQTIEFRPDGTFATPGGSGMWALDGDRLTFQGSRTVSARLQAPDANTITLIHDDGTLGRSTRCP
jgi:membrane protein involved in colicin uptake